MILFGLGGLAFAIGHHEYYSALHGTLTASISRQQWAHNIGNGFAALVVSMFHTAIGKAYVQYLWLTIRRKGHSLKTLDQIFALNSDPMGFFCLESLRKAPLTVFLGLISW